MGASSKIALVIGGYIVAFVAAFAFVSIYVAVTSGPDRQGSDGMYAFGDFLLFLGVFVLSAVPATVAALVFLRPYRPFWRVASILALGIAVTGIAALIGYLLPGSTNTNAFLGAWSSLSPLRILLAPLCAIAFLLCGLLAPALSYRVAFLSATAIETVVFCSGVVLILFHPFR
jgi:hypothetical protein